MKVEPVNSASGEFDGWMFECPGCGWHHVFDKRWTMTGTPECPTFAPSLLVRWGTTDESGQRCHSFVRAGRIQFLGDCTHALAGQTVDLPEIEP